MSKKEYEQAKKYIGNVIYKYRRVKKNISQEELAARTDTDANNLGRIERGEQFPEFLTFEKICYELGIKQEVYLSELIELTKEEK